MELAWFNVANHLQPTIPTFIAGLHANLDLIGAQRLRRNSPSSLSLFFVLILMCRLFFPDFIHASVSPLETFPNASTDIKTPVTLAWNVANKQLPLVDLPEPLLPDFDSRFTYPLDQFGFPLFHINYTNDGLIDSIDDSGDRSINFDYSRGHIVSVSQTWTSAAIRKTKTWRVVYETKVFAHANFSNTPGFGAVKAIPKNATTPSYTPQMANCDRLLASIFGGPAAVAAANGFEPAGLANQYPIYRGDIMGDDGVRRRGHLSYAMHLYGNPDATEDTALYIPIGFTSHSKQPTPTDAAVTFYYPHLGNLNNVTVAVFHVADFAINYEGDRVRIGSIGGRGGSYAFYKHSHIEFYRGNTGLPPGSARENLRIDPTVVFGGRF